MKKNSIKKSCITENFRTVHDGFEHFYQKGLICLLLSESWNYIWVCIFIFILAHCINGLAEPSIKSHLAPTHGDADWFNAGVKLYHLST